MAPNLSKIINGSLETGRAFESLPIIFTQAPLVALGAGSHPHTGSVSAASAAPLGSVTYRSAHGNT